MTEINTAAAELSPNKTLAIQRKKSLLILTTVITMIAFFLSIYWLAYARYYEYTDDAYVNGNIIPITTHVSGTVVTLNVNNTQYVKTGQVLVKLDPADNLVALQQAKANLAKTLRETQQLFINNESLTAIITIREAELDKANFDKTRRVAAIKSGAISQEELTNAEDAYKRATASLTQARAELELNRSLTNNTTVSQHPNVLAAASLLRQAYLNYARNIIIAPISGYISRINVQVGQHLATGAQLMSLVPLEQVWVDANFKEKQLRHMHIGQAVSLTADIYGSRILYHGKISGFSAGTGSAFSFLPAQNATGNWIKIVQRLPVRIDLNAQEIKKYPLQIGLSTSAKVDLHSPHKVLPAATINFRTYETKIYQSRIKEADTLVNQIIAENLKNTEYLDAHKIDDKSFSTKIAPEHL